MNLTLNNVPVTITGLPTGGSTPPQPPPTRLIPGTQQQIFPADYYCNSRVDGLPLDPGSAAKIASLGVGRLGPSPEFLLNLVSGQPAGAAIQWSSVNPECDGGNYPINPATLVSRYVFGNQAGQTLASVTDFSDDDHILVVNTSTGMLYETFAVSSNLPPYKLGNGAIWDLNGYALRSASKLIPYNVDSSGLTSADAAGMPIWPLCLTHAEVYSGAPILHGVRLSMPQALAVPGYQWPATHTAGGKGNSGIMLGATWRLQASFNASAIPAQFQPAITALKQYGGYITDFGSFYGISTDADQAWGDPNSPTSDIWTFAGILHSIPLSALEFVENQPRVISVLSGQVNQSPKWR